MQARRRSDLESVVSAIQNGTNTTQGIAELYPAAFIRYFRGINEYLKHVSPVAPRSFKTLLYVYWGPPGTGKSRRALQEATNIDAESIYYKPRGLWWDGYKQQRCVIVDDFYGWIKYDELLKITDRYPYKVQVKGGFEEFTSTHIWITSNVDIDEMVSFCGIQDRGNRKKNHTQRIHGIITHLLLIDCRIYNKHPS